MDIATSPIEVVRRPDISREAPSRSTEGQVIYAIGDVHGCYDLLVRLLAAIAEDAKAHENGRRPLLLLAGDYVDRGPQSDRVLATLVWLSRHSPFELVMLKGNHEAMLLDFLDRPFHAKGWLRVGGATTLASYGVTLPEGEQAIAEQCEAIRDEFMDQLPASHLDLLRSMPARATRGDYMFVHAGVNPLRPIDDQLPKDLCHIRELFLFARNDWGVLIVHGHQHEDRIEIRPNRVNLDTGACYGHRLSVGVFEGSDAHPSRYFQVVHPGLGKEGDLRIERLDADLELRSEGGASPEADAPCREATVRQWKP